MSRRCLLACWPLRPWYSCECWTCSKVGARNLTCTCTQSRPASPERWSDALADSRRIDSHRRIRIILDGYVRSTSWFRFPLPACLSVAMHVSTNTPGSLAVMYDDKSNELCDQYAFCVKPAHSPLLPSQKPTHFYPRFCGPVTLKPRFTDFGGHRMICPKRPVRVLAMLIAWQAYRNRGVQSPGTALAPTVDVRGAGEGSAGGKRPCSPDAAYCVVEEWSYSYW